MKRSNLYLVIALFLLSFFALFIRFYRLGVSPESLTWDEAALGYNAYSLSQTGADEYGQHLPLILRSFDDYKPALYAYLTIIPIKIWGLNIFSVRFISALSGAVLVWGVFLLGKAFFKNRYIALLAAALVVTNPLLLLYSRIGLEANLSLTLFTLGTAAVFYRDFKRYRYGLGVTLLVLAMYAYHSTRYIVPIVLITSLFIKDPNGSFNLAKKFRLCILGALFSLPVVYFILSKQFNTRFSETSVFTNSKVLFGNIANYQSMNIGIKTISQIYFFSLDLVGRYLGYFNPYQLFVNSSGHTLYHPDGLGVFNLFELPFWVLGLYLAIKKRKNYWPLLLVLFVSPIPAALTVDWFIPLRAILSLPFHLLLITIGIRETFTHIHSLLYKLCLITIGIFWLYQAILGVETVAIYQPYADAGNYQYGFAQIVPYINSIKSKYNSVIIGSPHAQPHIFFAFFSAYPPDKYQAETAWRRNDFTPRHNFDFGGYIFRSIYWPTDRNLKNTLFVGDTFQLSDEQLNQSKNTAFVKDFYAPDGSISFRITATNL